MLLWFVEPDVASMALTGKLIEEEVKIRPKICASCLDENVCLGSIQKYFCADVWLSILQAVECVKKHPVWYCGACTSAIMDDSEDSIMCDSCLIWHHFACTSLRQRPKSKVWFCHTCRAQ